MSNQIHWHEGLFLQPQHLQQLQKSVYDQFGTERRLSWAYPYGVIESRLSTDDLENYRIRFERLEVVMPNGMHIRFPKNSDLASLDIKDAFETHSRGFMVYLGLPHWFDSRPNTIEGERTVGARLKLLYVVPSHAPEFADENTGENPKPIQVRHFNALLLLDQDDDTDIEKIPLLRVVHDVSREEDFPRQDPEYVPPCLHLSASPTLLEMVRDLSSQVAAVREQLALVLARGDFDPQRMVGIQLEQVLRLRTLNRASARLSSLLAVGNGTGKVPTFEMYLELRDLLGELMALYPERGNLEIAPYDHDDPYPCYRSVISHIRFCLHGSVAPRFEKVDFQPTSESGLRRAVIPDHLFETALGFFLGIKTTQEPASLVRLVEDTDQFKIMPGSYRRHAVRGLVLREERFPPLELRAESGLYYFRLATTESKRIWKKIEEEGEMILQWSTIEEIPDFHAAVYMTLPADDTGRSPAPASGSRRGGSSQQRPGGGQQQAAPRAVERREPPPSRPPGFEQPAPPVRHPMADSPPALPAIPRAPQQQPPRQTPLPPQPEPAPEQPAPQPIDPDLEATLPARRSADDDPWHTEPPVTPRRESPQSSPEEGATPPPRRDPSRRRQRPSRDGRDG